MNYTDPREDSRALKNVTHHQQPTADTKAGNGGGVARTFTVAGGFHSVSTMSSDLFSLSTGMLACEVQLFLGFCEKAM